MKHFTLKELTQSPTAQSRGIDNQPTPEAITNLTALVEQVLDPLREALGTPIRVTSGYRSQALNRAIGGSTTSQHMRGEAVDFVCADMARAYDYIRQHLPHDQVIWEFGGDHQPKWIHVSYRRDGRNRRQALRASKTPAGKTYYSAYK